MSKRRFKSKFCKKAIPFEKRPRAQRKLCYIQVKNEIRLQAPEFGGLFSCDSYIDSNNSWLDLWFLSKRRPLVMYNVTLDTTIQAYCELISDAAFDATYDLKNEAMMRELEMKVESRDRRTGAVTAAFTDPPPRAEFNGLTSTEWYRQQEKHIAKAGELRVYEKWTLHHDYSTGIGLHAVVHEPFLTIDAVNRFVKRFLLDEIEFMGVEPFRFTYDEYEGAIK
jgi:hypothetical protein